MSEYLHNPCPMCGHEVSKKEIECPSCGERLRHPDLQDLSTAEQMLVWKFGNQCLWLGGMWIFVGVICAITGLLIITGLLSDWKHSRYEYGFQASLVLDILMAVTGVVMMTLGFNCRRRNHRGIYFSPLFCYLALVGSLLLWNLCLLPVVIVFLIQSHLVLRTARRMKQAGIPLQYQL